MEPAPEPVPLHLAAPAFARALAAILVPLAAMVASAFLRDPLRVGLIVPVWTRLMRASRRFGRLMARAAVGRHAVRPRAPRTSPRVRKPCVVLPSREAWLARALSHHGAGYASQLDHLLERPDSVAVLAAVPQAARLLRPLCRMLGVHPAALPPLPRRVRKSRRVVRPAVPQRPPVGKIFVPRLPLPLLRARLREPCERMLLRWPWSSLPPPQPA